MSCHLDRGGGRRGKRDIVLCIDTLGFVLKVWLGTEKHTHTVRLKYPKKIYCNFRTIEFVLQDTLHRKLFKAPEEKNLRI